MQPKKRKHEKVDLTKFKVQYLVDVQLKSTEKPDLLSKKSPELVKMDYDSTQNMLKNTHLGLRTGKLYDWSGSGFGKF